MSSGNSTTPNSATSRFDPVYTNGTVYTFHGDISATYADRLTEEEISIDPPDPLTPGSQDPFDEYYVKYWYIIPRGQSHGGSVESKRYNDFSTQSHGTTLDLEDGQTTKLSNGKVVYPFKVVQFPISLEEEKREVHNLDSVPTKIHLYAYTDPLDPSRHEDGDTDRRAVCAEETVVCEFDIDKTEFTFQYLSPKSLESATVFSWKYQNLTQDPGFFSLSQDDGKYHHCLMDNGGIFPRIGKSVVGRVQEFVPDPVNPELSG